jgi:hypothetical protein
MGERNRLWKAVVFAVLFIVFAVMAIIAFSCAKDAMQSFRICFSEQCITRSVQSIMLSLSCMLLYILFMFLAFATLIIMVYVCEKN